MKRLKGTPAEGRVSYADLIALGGAYAVALTGGPAIDIPIGAFLNLTRIADGHGLSHAAPMCP